MCGLYGYAIAKAGEVDERPKKFYECESMLVVVVSCGCNNYFSANDALKDEG